MLALLIIQAYLVSAIVLVFVMIRLIGAYRFRYKPMSTDDSIELPTVSVCIPVRNETHAMAECLEAVLASDYRKLEVIVLDDNSSDNTPYIIRAFAHAGVRFVEGGQLPDGWVGKNYSLERLLGEARSKYIIFMDVDVKIKSDTISRLVAEVGSAGVEMVSVVPQRKDFYRISTWFGTLRFLWELVLHRQSTPSASSALWIVNRKQLLDDLGGFRLWRDAVQPERHIASEFAKTDSYRLIVSTPQLNVSFEKKWRSQLETSQRLLMQRLGNSLSGILLGIGLLLMALVPQIALIATLFYGYSPETGLLIGLAILSIIDVWLFYRLFWQRFWWLSPVVAVFVVWQEFILMVASVIGYQRGTISWKGRSIDRPGRIPEADI